MFNMLLEPPPPPIFSELKLLLQKMGDIDLDELNKSEDYSRKYEKVDDNQTSVIKVTVLVN